MNNPLGVNINFKSGEWYDENTHYQILLVKPGNNNRSKGKYIETTIITAKRGKSSTEATNFSQNKERDFSEYKIDNDTKKKLKDYPRQGHEDYIGSYLPSSGVVFPAGFVKSLVANPLSNQTTGQDVNSPYSIIGLDNFYDPIRTLLYSRKISQLIAKTWWTYLEAKKTVVKSEDTLWKQFTKGRWDKIIKNQSNSNILDGLIAREIFLLDSGSAPDYLEPPNLNIYYPLHTTPINTLNQVESGEDQKKKFLILPDSKAWQGIALSLLMTGQAYYEVKENNEIHYHQISQPILSTGEIIIKYAVDVSWNHFTGVQKELIVSPGTNSTSMQVIAPYPPIPSEDNLDPKDIKKWADAEDDVPFTSQDKPDPDKNEEFPFYIKRNETEYLVDVKYFSPPYPYIPLSCC